MSDPFGYEVFERFAQYPLGREPAYLEAVGKPSGELRQVSIEKRGARFEAVSHAHAIHFDEEILGEVCAVVQIQELSERCTVFDFVQKTLEVSTGVDGSATSQERGKFICVEEATPRLDTLAQG